MNIKKEEIIKNKLPYCLETNNRNTRLKYRNTEG